MATLQYLVVSALSLLLLVVVANALVALYARGAVRDALDEGVRAGALTGTGAGECEERARDVLWGLLRGPLGDDVEIACHIDGPWIVATADARFASWLPDLLPAWDVDAQAFARRSS